MTYPGHYLYKPVEPDLLLLSLGLDIYKPVQPDLLLLSLGLDIYKPVEPDLLLLSLGLDIYKPVEPDLLLLSLGLDIYKPVEPDLLLLSLGLDIYKPVEPDLLLLSLGLDIYKPVEPDLLLLSLGLDIYKPVEPDLLLLSLGLDIYKPVQPSGQKPVIFEIPLCDILAVQTPSRDGATTSTSARPYASTSSAPTASSSTGSEDNNNQSVVVHYAGRRKDSRSLTWEKLLLSGDTGLCSELNNVCNCNIAGHGTAVSKPSISRCELTVIMVQGLQRLLCEIPTAQPSTGIAADISAPATVPFFVSSDRAKNGPIQVTAPRIGTEFYFLLVIKYSE
ncbi:hypothetical protein RRG08_057021 [Elysia crispata]|uniref:Uncharacterized protein n=1 Tax=Elysia crispata TaxID=231223 RepID=A0AAE0Z660_9GAST|nr:hypothetical protein RRG08_057021 [Elysia crispata]